MDRKGREVGRDPNNKDNILVWVGSSHEMLEGLHTKFGGVPRSIPTDKNDYVEDFFDLEPHKLFLTSIKESLITDYNSLYELTMSGWNMDGELHGVLHPYISVRIRKQMVGFCGGGTTQSKV